MITVFSFVRSFFSSSCYVCLEAANGACDAIVASAALSLALSLSLFSFCHILNRILTTRVKLISIIEWRLIQSKRPSLQAFLRTNLYSQIFSEANQNEREEEEREKERKNSMSAQVVTRSASVLSTKSFERILFRVPPPPLSLSLSRARAYTNEARGATATERHLGPDLQDTESSSHVLRPRSLGLVKALAWTSSLVLGIYLVGIHDWDSSTQHLQGRGQRGKKNVFSEIKPQIKKAFTLMHGEGGERQGRITTTTTTTQKTREEGRNV